MALNTFKCNCLTTLHFKGLNTNINVHIIFQVASHGISHASL